MRTNILKRRWFQFSLLTLLITMLVSCFGFAWIGVRLRQARQNRDRVVTSEQEIKEAVATIEELGGSVTCAYEELRPQTWLESQFNDPGGPDDPVRGVKVTCADFSRIANIGDGLEHLRKLPNLEYLDLSNTQVSGAELEKIRTLGNLYFLFLSNTSVSDADAEHLQGLTNLGILDLTNTQITSTGMQHLKGLIHLKSLELSGTGVTDAGLEHLKRLKNLKALYLADTKVTDVGVDELQALLPNCKIDRVTTHAKFKRPASG